MASVLHGSARTTPRIRAELPVSKEAPRSLAARYDLNPKTVRKWRQRTTTADAPMGVIWPQLVVSQKPPAAYWFTALHFVRQSGSDDRARSPIALPA